MVRIALNATKLLDVRWQRQVISSQAKMERSSSAQGDTGRCASNATPLHVPRAKTITSSTYKRTQYRSAQAYSRTVSRVGFMGRRASRARKHTSSRTSNVTFSVRCLRNGWMERSAKSVLHTRGTMRLMAQDALSQNALEEISSHQMVSVRHAEISKRQTPLESSAW